MSYINKNNSIRFSILVPTYNQAEYLPGALDSLIAQTYPNWEALVVNDGSVDDTEKILADYAAKDKRFRIFNKENGGTGSALNEGLKHAKGEWICWLSTDDLFVPEKLEIHKNAIEKYPGIKFFYSNYYVIKGNEDEIIPANDSAYSIFYLPPVQTLGFFAGNYIHGLSVAINKSIFEELGPFDETIRYAQDFDMWVRIVSKYKAQYIDERTVISRFYDTQITTAHPEWGIWDSTRALFNFLNNHSFEEIFPFLDFNDIYNVFFAVDQVLELSLNKNSFIYKIFYSAALLEKLREWLFLGLKREFKEIVSKRINLLLDNYGKHGFLKDLPANIIEAFENLREAVFNSYSYPQHFFIEEVRSLLKRLNKIQDHEAYSQIELYLNKITEHYDKIVSPENLLPEKPIYELNDRESEIEPLNIVNSLMKFKESGAELILKIEENNKSFPLKIKVNDVKKIPPFYFNSPVTSKRFYFSSELLLKSFTNLYDFRKAFNKVKEKILSGKKITFAFTVIDAYVKGGGTNNIFKLANLLNQSGYETTIYSNAKMLNLEGESKNDDIIENLVEKYSEIKEDVIIVFSINELPALFRQCDCSEKIVFHLCQGVETFHYHNSTYESLVSEKEYFRLLHSIPVGRLVVSKKLFDYFKENFNQASLLVTNGISQKYFDAKKHYEKKSNDTIKILFIGNPKFFLKGFKVFVEAITIFANKHAKKKLKILVLDGSKEKHEREKNVFMGVEYESFSCFSVDCMIKQYREADVYVNASFYEGFGLPTIEAMACGVPVIQSDFKGRMEELKHGENCLLFEPNNPEDLVEKLSELLENFKLRSRIIENGYKTAGLFTEYRQKLELQINLMKFIGLLNEYPTLQESAGKDNGLNQLLELKSKANERNEKPVDIVLLTYKRKGYFKETIDALIKRTRYPYRIIIVDNDSDEEFKVYLKQSEILYDKIIYNQRNEWTSAFQKGIDVSESDPFVVSDPDILVPDLEGKCWLERLIDLHKQNPEVGLLALNLDASNKPEKMPDVYLGEKIQYNEEIILSNVGTVMQAIKRKYFDFPYVTDWETCERIRRNGGKVGFAKNIVAYHLGWNEENDYPEYIVDKYKYFKENYDVDVYKLYTSDSNLLQKMEDAGSLSEYYSYDRPEVRKLVDKNAKRILDVGCSSGKLGGKLKEELGAEVWGIEIVEKVARKAREKLDEVLIGSVEEKISELPDKYFDTIIFADILEHLVNPDAVLKKIKRKLNNKGELIVSIPNVRHWTVIKALLDGSWQYEEAGILDKTHLRFFTFETALEMLKRAGFEAVKIEGTKLNDYEFPDSFIRKLREEGFNVDDLQEKSAHYQYIFKARQVASVSIVIPVYNQAEYLEQAVNSILVNTLEDIEIILVDNNSDDDTQVLLNKLEKNDKIKIIRNTENLGFPKAVNQGITASQGEFVLAANSDIVCTKDFLRKMIDRAEADDSIGIVGPVSNEVSGFQKLEKVNYETLEEMPAFAEKVSTENKGKTLEFPRVAFLCTLIKREVIEKIGGLDERFSPGNYEDDDFCLRAQLAGFKTVIALDVFVHHYGSKSFTADGEDKYRRLLEKNKKKFVEKWGASPDEIWLRNKSHKMPELFIPLENASDPSTLVKSANQKINENNYSGAYDDLKEAIGALENNSFKFNEADFKKHDLLNLAGKVALYLGKFDESKNLFTKELQIGKSNARAYESLGDLFEKTGDEETALKCYTVAFSLNDKKELKEKINKLEKKLV